MTSDVVVVLAPVVDGRTGIGQTGEPVQVEAVLPEFAVEAVDEGVLRGFPWRDEVQLDARVERPEEHRLAGGLRTVVAHDRSREQMGRAPELTDKALSGDRRVDHPQHALA